MFSDDFPSDRSPSDATDEFADSADELTEKCLRIPSPDFLHFGVPGFDFGEFGLEEDSGDPGASAAVKPGLDGVGTGAARTSDDAARDNRRRDRIVGLLIGSEGRGNNKENNASDDDESSFGKSGATTFGVSLDPT